MSTLSNWSYTQTMTVWPSESYDEFGQPSFGTAYSIIGSWSIGGDTQVDASGEEFVATSKYYFEYDPDSSTVPRRGYYIKRGSHIGADPITAGAEKIKKVDAYDVAMFGSTQVPDFVVYT